LRFVDNKKDILTNTFPLSDFLACLAEKGGQRGEDRNLEEKEKFSFSKQIPGTMSRNIILL
jgi:hypothetical protein